MPTMCGCIIGCASEEHISLRCGEYEMIEFNKDLLEELLAAARRNPRLRQGRDMRTSEADSSQRMLNALLPGTVVAVHRHPRSAETVVCLRGRMDEVILEERDGRLVETERIRLCPEEGRYGCQVPAGCVAHGGGS